VESSEIVEIPLAPLRHPDPPGQRSHNLKKHLLLFKISSLID
jgi:hypothetical protein